MGFSEGSCGALCAIGCTSVKSYES